MNTTFRFYNHAADYQRVSEFLVRTYSAAGEHINWLQPRWEYMHYHPGIKKVDLSSIGVWEAKGEPVHRIAYIEPVCTDHDYRRMGLASAAILEGIRRCGKLGATVAYVGAIKPIYLSLVLCYINKWK